MTINGALHLALGSSNVFELNKELRTNDVINGLTSVSYDGTLVITNLGGTLAHGDAFKLFSADSYRGAFQNIVPPRPATGLRWATAGLAVDGSLRIASDPSPPLMIASVVREPG